MDYTFAIKELLCRCRSNPVLVEFLASNGSNVMDPLAIPLRISSHWHSGAFCINRNFEIGIQSLYILKMWQFDYAFRYYQCEVRISSSRRKHLQRNVRCGFAYHQGYNEIRFRFVLAMNTFHSVHNVMLIITRMDKSDSELKEITNEDSGKWSVRVYGTEDVKE
ncbi:hypothetical protein T02_1649 [Trichinella nativa]|uniref:Uncharacterized protein n=1 Tax=Trichinella nativa TaxID=6335 RepID=A0A0V1LRZ3_9BILA|nr:hypothetical protein T02_1649 [Trichinella nativa]